MMSVKTSETHPIRVDFVATDALPLSGRIGLTFAPGKKQPNSLNGRWDRDLDQDLARLRDHYQADILVTLIEAHEFVRLGIPDLRERAQDRGMESIWFPIPDASVPASIERFAETIDRLIRLLDRGQTVVIHCMGGLGRTGLVAAAILIATSVKPDEAIRAVRTARIDTIETPAQEAYVEEFYRFITSRQTPRQQE